MVSIRNHRVERWLLWNAVAAVVQLNKRLYLCNIKKEGSDAPLQPHTMTYEQEKIKPYGTQGEKGQQVAAMFDNISTKYDLLNHLLSAGIDKRWRKSAIEGLRPYAPQEILDVATGTGDFAIESAQRLRPRRLLGVDISEGMMAVGRRKVKEVGLEDVISFAQEDCLHLSLEDNRFDAVTVAYGVRNFADLEQGLREMLRVLRPGGRLVIIELTAPAKAPMKQLFKVYARYLMPMIGKIISKDTAAYAYLPATMEVFPQGEQMKAILEKVGYRDVRFERFTFGLSTLYTACK